MGDFSRDLELLSRQPAQSVSEFNRCGIGVSTGALIPPAESRAHWRRQQVFDGFVNSGGMGPFEHLKQIVRGDQGAQLAQVLRDIARLAEVLVIALLQLWISEVHAAPDATRRSVKLAGPAAGSSSSIRQTGRFFVHPSFAYRERAGSRGLAVEPLNGRPGAFRRDHCHEAETARPWTRVIDRNPDGHDVAIGGKQIHQLVLRRGDAQVLDVYFGVHSWFR